MLCLSVLRRGFGGTIYLDEYEAFRRVVLLNYVEAGNSRFLYAVARVLDSRLPKRVDQLRFHMHVDMNDKHSRIAAQDGVGQTPRWARLLFRNAQQTDRSRAQTRATTPWSSMAATKRGPRQADCYSTALSKVACKLVRKPLTGVRGSVS